MLGRLNEEVARTIELAAAAPAMFLLLTEYTRSELSDESRAALPQELDTSLEPSVPKPKAR